MSIRQKSSPKQSGKKRKSKTGGAATSRRRQLSKEQRRQQLIEATVDSIAERGFADTTLSHVSKSAGLSQGIVNLHFTNKETLLIETLRYLRDEYQQAWRGAVNKAGDHPAEKLSALVTLDFDQKICRRKKLAVWFAFLGEARSRPTYSKICEEHDSDYSDVLVTLCQALIDDGGYSGLDPLIIAGGLEAMSEGLWLSLLVTPKQTTRELARETCFAYLAQFFPDHFSATDSGAQP